MNKFNWNSDPDKEVERELGAEFLRAVNKFYSVEENRKEFDIYAYIHLSEPVQPKQTPFSGAEASLCTVPNVGTATDGE